MTPKWRADVYAGCQRCGSNFITVLAYQCVEFLRVKLKAAGITDSWATLRDILSMQRRVTATFSQSDGRSLHVCTATVAAPDLLAIFARWASAPHPEKPNN